jgi:hypothetical protein
LVEIIPIFLLLSDLDITAQGAARGVGQGYLISSEASVFSSSPRRRGSSQKVSWIPAYAGMTAVEAELEINNLTLH